MFSVITVLFVVIGAILFLRKNKSESGSSGDVDNALSKVDIFRNMGARDLRLIRSATEAVEFPANSKLFSQGDDGDSLYIIKNGRVQIYLEIENVEKNIARIKKGGLIGEMSLLTGEKRTASARTINKTTALKIDCEAFYKLNEQSPNLRKMIWLTYTWRVFDNFVRSNNIPANMSLKDRRRWFAKHHETDLKISKEAKTIPGAYCAFVITGSILYLETEYNAPAFFEVFNNQKLKGLKTSRIIWLPPFHL
jgi:CRP-like cAMP-binding protein